LGHRTEPAVPVDILRRAFLLDVVVPFALGSVAAVIALAPNERSDFAVANQARRLVPGTGGTTLRTDLENPARALDDIVNPKGLVEITDHRLLGIHMFAGFHGINANARVPGVVGRHHDGVDVLSLDHFSVVDVNIGV